MKQLSAFCIVAILMNTIPNVHAAPDEPVAPVVEKVAGGFQFTEGPVWDRRGFLLFSDIPANTIYRLNADGTTAVYRAPSNRANGNTFDGENRLLSATHDAGLVREEADGSTIVLFDAFEGKHLNSPNDVVVKSDGAIYFTDPDYGMKQPNGEIRAREVEGNNGYYLLPDGTRGKFDGGFSEPNGLAFSPDERTLYVSDTKKGVLRSFTVQPDGTLQAHDEAWATLKAAKGERGTPDGLKVDVEGRVYASGPGGVWVFEATGQLQERIRVPEVVTNLAWGDTDGKTLYITAGKSLYKMRRSIGGILPGAKKNQQPSSPNTSTRTPRE